MSDITTWCGTGRPAEAGHASEHSSGCLCPSCLLCATDTGAHSAAAPPLMSRLDVSCPRLPLSPPAQIPVEFLLKVPPSPFCRLAADGSFPLPCFPLPLPPWSLLAPAAPHAHATGTEAHRTRRKDGRLQSLPLGQASSSPSVPGGPWFLSTAA